ncbi:MAG: ATP-binding protein [Paludibacteraceae bacterium]|nr:ATP-binding protein [Paludibacteraceae bacterium]
MLMIDISLVEYMREQLNLVSTEFMRYEYDKIDWSLRMVGLVGARGVGKSTLVLQHIKMSENQKALYVSADNSYFSQHTLVEVASDFVKEGGTHFYIDEIHKYPSWSTELKVIYDGHPSLHVVFTGSSILDLLRGQADLSRRVVMYQMQGLSFREYLQMFHGIRLPRYDLEDIINNRVDDSLLPHPLPLFRQYLRSGYYPFSKEGAFLTRIEQVVMQTLESDIPQFASMTVSTGRKLRKLMGIIAQSAPFKPDYSSIANALTVSRNVVPDYLLYMERAGMIGQLRDETGGIRSLGKVEKVFMDNSNLMYALANDNTNIGNVRETFFYNQTRVTQDVIASKVSDFVIGEHTFEVGGKGKGGAQIENVPNGHIVKDDIEYGFGRTIPLWTFGLLY